MADALQCLGNLLRCFAGPCKEALGIDTQCPNDGNRFLFGCLQALQERKLQQMLELTVRVMERKQAAAVDVSMQLVLQAYSKGLLQLAAGLSNALATSGSLGASTVAAASAGMVAACILRTAEQLW